MTTIDDIKRMNRDTGGHFFDVETMSHWDSETLPEVEPFDDGWFFVTREPDFQGDDPRYTIRYCHSNGRIVRGSEFRAYVNATTAVSAMRIASRAKDLDSARAILDAL